MATVCFWYVSRRARPISAARNNWSLDAGAIGTAKITCATGASGSARRVHHRVKEDHARRHC